MENFLRNRKTSIFTKQLDSTQDLNAKDVNVIVRYVGPDNFVKEHLFSLLFTNTKG